MVLWIRMWNIHSGSSATYNLLFSFFSYLLLQVIRILPSILSEDDNLTLGFPF